ncbi:uncharacterized protein [Ptychodera flava]|uniref:uncharacterized protein n=1 Tax=Ptychodera flava TaxID=63121 RepID=UPI00396A9277
MVQISSKEYWTNLETAAVPYLEVDVPETAVRAVLEQQRQWRLKKAENESQEVIKKRATQKKNRKRRLRHEKTRMDSIRATGVTTVEYVGKSMAVDQSDSSDEDETVIIEDNMASATPTVTTTPSSTVATNNASTQAAATSSTYGTGTEAGIEQVPSMQSRIFIIFDLEGTGGNTHRDSIIEIGASAYIPHRIQDLETPLEFSTLVKTSAKIKSIVAMKTGISQECYRANQTIHGTTILLRLGGHPCTGSTGKITTHNLSSNGSP